MSQPHNFLRTRRADLSAAGTYGGMSVAAIIEETIADADFDSRSVSMALKQFERLSKERPDSEIGAELSRSVQELQGIDIFVQKLGHIKVLHEMVAQNGFTEGRDLINRLNHLQSAAASSDYEAIVSTLSQRLDTLQRLAPDGHLTDTDGPAHFGRRKAIFDKMNALSEIFSRSFSGAEDQAARLDQVSGEAITKIKSIYSIDSERFVLDWLMSNVQGTDADLLKTYDSHHLYAGMHCADDIELF